MTAVVEPGEPMSPVAGIEEQMDLPVDASSYQLVLPEPPPNRAEELPAGDAGRWLREVVATDRHGYAMLSGLGWTTVALYVDGALIAVSRIRGNDDLLARDVLRTLDSYEAGPAFAVAHRLRPGLALSLSGLFAAPAWLVMTGPERTLADILDRLRVTEFAGAIHVGFDRELWAIALFESGVPVASYGSDDRGLKPDLADLTVLHAFDAVSVAIHPHVEMDLQVVFGDSRPTSTPPRTADNRDLITVESMLIEALSAFEHGLVTAPEAMKERREGIALALVATYQHLANAQVVIGAASQEDAPTHPLIAGYWSESQRQIDTTRLLDALRLATILDAWSVAIHALCGAIERRVRQQSAWLAQADAASASVLAETATDLLHRARALAGLTGPLGR